MIVPVYMNGSYSYCYTIDGCYIFLYIHINTYVSILEDTLTFDI